MQSPIFDLTDPTAQPADPRLRSILAESEAVAQIDLLIAAQKAELVFLTTDRDALEKSLAQADEPTIPFDELDALDRRIRLAELRLGDLHERRPGIVRQAVTDCLAAAESELAARIKVQDRLVARRDRLQAQLAQAEKDSRSAVAEASEAADRVKSIRLVQRILAHD